MSHTHVELVCEWTPETGQPHRAVYATDAQGWLRIESRWTGTKWLEVGCERITAFSIDGNTAHSLEEATQ